MQPWNSPDLLPIICSHVTSVHSLAALSGVNKALNKYLFSVSGGRHWIDIGRLVCGEKYWEEAARNDYYQHLITCLRAGPSSNITNDRLLTMKRMCPWILEPQTIKYDTRRTTIEVTDEERQTVNRLREWMPQDDDVYGTIRRAVKLHDSVLVVTASSYNSKSLQGYAYFVSAKDFKLLRDMQISAEWQIEAGHVYCIRPSVVLRFGGECVMAPVPLNPQNTFWLAYRGGDPIKILKEIGPKARHHNVDLAWHVIAGGIGSIEALLIEEPSFICSSTFRYALEFNREAAAKFIFARLVPDVQHAKKALRSWLEYACKQKMPDAVRILLSLGAEAREKTACGRRLADILLGVNRHKLARNTIQAMKLLLARENPPRRLLVNEKQSNDNYLSRRFIVK